MCAKIDGVSIFGALDTRANHHPMRLDTLVCLGSRSLPEPAPQAGWPQYTAGAEVSAEEAKHKGHARVADQKLADQKLAVPGERRDGMVASSPAGTVLKGGPSPTIFAIVAFSCCPPAVGLVGPASACWNGQAVVNSGEMCAGRSLGSHTTLLHVLSYRS